MEKTLGILANMLGQALVQLRYSRSEGPQHPPQHPPQHGQQFSKHFTSVTNISYH